MSGSGDYTTTANFGLYKPTYAADVGNWGTHLNDNADRIDSLLFSWGVGVGSEPPADPVPGQLWFDASNPQLYVYYDDGTSAQWVIATANAGGITTDAPSDGTLYGRWNGTWQAFTVEVPAGGSIQAAHDALPATGGVITLAANATYNVTTTINLTKPNVRITAPSWSTIIRRTVGMSGAVLNFTGACGVIEHLTVDGNATAYDGTSHTELAFSADNCLADHVQVMNGGGTTMLTVTGEGSCARNCTITGLGINPPTQTGYGIWAINHNSVKILNNTITGTGIDAIGFDGAGSIVSGNRITGCHCYTGNSGGVIACYSTSTGAVIANNTIGVGGGNFADGIEIAGVGALVTGNEIIGTQGLGIHLDASCSHTLIDGNLIKDTGAGGANLDGIYIQAGVSDFQIINNRILDTKVTKTMRSAISIVAGAGDRFVISGNVLAPFRDYAMADSSTGLDKIITDNVGIDDVIFTRASAATITMPLNSTVSLTGTTTITAIAAANSWTGRKVTLVPTGAIAVTAGNNIANSITTAPNVPVQAVFDGALWYFLSPSAANFASPGPIGGTTPAAGTFSVLTVSAAAGTQRAMRLLTTGGGSRFQLLADNVGEGGSNAGSNFQLAAYDDSGNFLFNCLSATRSSGLITMSRGAVVSALSIGTAAGPTWTTGTGAPATTAPIGSMFSRTDGGVGTTLYVSRGGGTWNAVAGV